MAKRTRVILQYSYDENWIGGTYYIQNLIIALNRLGDSLKPHLLIWAGKQEDFVSLKAITNYPYLELIKLDLKRSIVVRAIDKLTRTVFGRVLFGQKRPKFDLFIQIGSIESTRNRKILYWIPDFQEKYYPEFFREEDLISRSKFQLLLLKKGKNLLFSSESAKNDFNKFYPGSNLNQFVLPFSSSLPSLNNNPTFDDLLVKYKLPAKYFICCNQFWIHKNHGVVLRAIHELKNNNVSITVAFTGKDFDYRSPDYANSLKNFCKEFNIEENVKFLGFIDRTDQLKLIKNATAVIQPSLFEGWSTVIEDGKALNTKIIASNIDVHQEQLINYPSKLLFDPLDEKSLASCLTDQQIGETHYEYDLDILKFANSFLDIANKIIN